MSGRCVIGVKMTRYLDMTQSQQPNAGQGRLILEVSGSRPTVGRNPLDEWSAHRRGLCLKTHNTYKRDLLSPAEFEPAIPASDRPQSLALDRSATGIGGYLDILVFHGRLRVRIHRRKKFHYSFRRACEVIDVVKPHIVQSRIVASWVNSELKRMWKETGLYQVTGLSFDWQEWMK